MDVSRRIDVVELRLVIVGAEGFVMSLWQVDHFATRDLIAGHTRGLKAGKSSNARSSALRDLRKYIASRLTYAHPYFWPRSWPPTITARSTDL